MLDQQVVLEIEGVQKWHAVDARLSRSISSSAACAPKLCGSSSRSRSSSAFSALSWARLLPDSAMRRAWAERSADDVDARRVAFVGDAGAYRLKVSVPVR